MLNAMKPIKSADWITALYDETLARLTSHGTDTEVRACAEDCMGDIWIAAMDIARSKDKKEWEYICRTTGKLVTAVTVVNKVASSVKVGDEWVNGCVSWRMFF
jgi:cullin-associated NEDD8-dissociated protein 1